jgi:hypothetical protein
MSRKEPHIVAAAGAEPPDERIVVHALAASAEDPQRMESVHSYAEVIAGVLGDELCGQLLAGSAEGGLVQVLVGAMPRLGGSEAFLREVERSLRELYAPEAAANETVGAGAELSAS